MINENDYLLEKMDALDELESYLMGPEEFYSFLENDLVKVFENFSTLGDLSYDQAIKIEEILFDFPIGQYAFSREHFTAEIELDSFGNNILERVNREEKIVYRINIVKN